MWNDFELIHISGVITRVIGFPQFVGGTYSIFNDKLCRYSLQFDKIKRKDSQYTHSCEKLVLMNLQRKNLLLKLSSSTVNVRDAR
jgi:hypothetical protein